MLRYLIALVLGCGLLVSAYAGTPVEDLIANYESAQGARNYKAKGAAMAVGRTFLKKYPIAPFAEDIDEMLILRMQRTSPDVQESFAADFMKVMEDYMYVGKQDTKQGVVDVYCLTNEVADAVIELIVYNPQNYALNCLRGDMSVEDLMKIRKPVEE